jgi:Uma2 family endonuclease
VQRLGGTVFYAPLRVRVAPGRCRDTVIKRADYAEAGIPEYWIVNPEEASITVLKLENGVYISHGVFRRGETATSALLTGFTVNVDAVCDAE